MTLATWRREMFPEEDLFVAKFDIFSRIYHQIDLSCSISVAKLVLHHPVWPDLAKFHHFYQYLKIFGNIFEVYLGLGKVFNSSCHNLYAFGQISLLYMAKYWKHNLVIWSHCSSWSRLCSAYKFGLSWSYNRSILFFCLLNRSTNRKSFKQTWGGGGKKIQKKK